MLPTGGSSLCGQWHIAVPWCSAPECRFLLDQTLLSAIYTIILLRPRGSICAKDEALAFQYSRDLIVVEYLYFVCFETTYCGLVIFADCLKWNNF